MILHQSENEDTDERCVLFYGNIIIVIVAIT